LHPLYGTFRRVPRPLLKALTQGFRKRFSIAGAAVTIADRIVQKRHHDWIKAFLASHRQVRSANQHQPSRAAESLT
jgi:hypothetical protein